MRIIELNEWGDDEIHNSAEITLAADQIRSSYEKLKEQRCISRSDEDTYQRNVDTVLNYWVGNTYVGKRKSDCMKQAFQAFFDSLYDLLIFYKEHGDSNKKKFANETLYAGTLYRYLGHRTADAPQDNDIVQPVYDEIWVSWSKNKQNHYLESKLYRPITRITCKTKELYGIDLSICGISNEAEVVYPTFENCHTGTEYLY